ncbi:MAG: DUF1249 domain-containing protein [Gammaproteobacteria bacterium]|nr:DUF1249 domain-containing protein [Gammaproteobacteria bacterium]NIP90401.1 DUF1249 domain-containing protein [Gammaproteobacteria bacterium]NIR25029.1 DUF1249 domain-containing protein [Gammaproteobacteria bacterium]NIS06730.1 DUF1249 domain-containing protein [Gammaproteobacteria bacterium]NIU41360.1 DUF1249 domain-containing protein [Gammaproteobacteria bacterium]
MELLKTGHLERYRHRDLPALIDLYEGNYLRVMRLLPDLEDLEGTLVSQVAGALNLYATVEERFKYTTTLFLTYRFEDEGEFALEPNARVCVYHDVRAAELVSHCRRKRTRKVHSWIRGRMPELDRRWEMNRFLYKWLKFCTNQGHIFLNCTARPTQDLSRLPTR